MQPSVHQIIKLIHGFAPFDLAEKWDNSGLQAGDPDGRVEKIFISLDLTMEGMAAAKAWGADLVITHHPLLIRPEASFDFRKMPGAAIAMAAREKISIVSAHTNLDKARNGLNDYFAQRLGILVDEALCRDLPPGPNPDKFQGIGRIGQLTPERPFKEFVAQVKECLSLDHIRVTGDLNLSVKKVALCTGSGGSLMDAFIESPADVYITGDIKYHEARKIEPLGKGLIDVGHFASEIIGVDLLVSLLHQAILSAGYQIQLKGFKGEKDPFKTL